MYVLDFFNSPIKKSPFPEWTWKNNPQCLPGWIHLNFICGPRLPWPPFHSQWFPWYMGEKKTCSSQTLSLKPRPFKSLIHDIQNPCKIEYGDLRRNYANLRRNLGMCFLAFVYFFLKRIFGILSGKHHGLLTTFLQQQAVTGLAKPLTLDQNDGREEMNQNLWPMWCQTPTNAVQVEFQKCRWNNREMP